MTQSSQNSCPTGIASTEHAASPADAKALIDQGVTLIDVRRAQFRDGQPRLANAAWVPLDELEDYFASGKAGALGITSNEQSIMLFCATGAGSINSTAQLRARGYTGVRYVEGGIQAWQAAGLPVIQA